MSDERHYLAYRDKNGLRKIEVFEDQGEALSKYSFAEHVCMFGDTPGLDCCLFGSDSLATLCKTHSSWFAPETLDIHALCDQTTPRNPPNPALWLEP